MQKDKYLIQTEDLVLTLNSNPAYEFHYGNMNIEYGRFVEIVGPNGSGKSTFLNLLLNYASHITIKKGSIKICGEDLFTLKTENVKANIVNINQEEDFIHRESLYAYLIRPTKATLEYFSRQERQQKLLELEEHVTKIYDTIIAPMIYKANSKHSLKNVKDKIQFKYLSRFSSLSGGQQKIMHILQGVLKACFCKYPLVLLDEPLNNLDKENKKLLIKIIQNLRNERPEMLFLIVTHCRVFPFIDSKISLTVETNKTMSYYNVYNDRLVPYNCLD